MKARALLVVASFALSLAGCGDAASRANAEAAPSSAPSASATGSTTTAATAEPIDDAGADASTDDAGAVDAGAPDAGVVGIAQPRRRALEPPEETKSTLPKPDEWTDVPRKDVAVEKEYECVLQHVREWHRIRCNASNATVALVAGTREGVSVWSHADEAHLFFPVRKGDARVFELQPRPREHMEPGPYGFSFTQVPGGPPLVISETWLDGEDAPTLTVQ
ncbi:MAG TPA: hypothetical protein VGM56_03210 [Byssovorax sp.]